MEIIMNLFSGWGAILVAVCMMLTVALNLPKWLHYVWALLVLVSGILAI